VRTTATTAASSTVPSRASTSRRVAGHVPATRRRGRTGTNSAAEVNGAVENIGARRLHTVLEKLLEDISFDAADRAGSSITIDADYVRAHVAALAKNADLSKFIL